MGDEIAEITEFRELLQALHDTVQPAAKFEILKNAVVMIATPPAVHAGENAVPHLEEAIQRYYQEIAEEEPPQIDVTNDEQVAFDAIRDHVINNLDVFNNNNLAATEVIEEFAGDMHGGSRNKRQRSYRKKRSTRRNRRSTRRKSYRKKTHKRK